MTKQGWLKTGAALLVATAAALTLLYPRAASLDNAARDAARDALVTREGCAMTQTILYSKCGHEVTRRLDLPDDQIGLSYEAIANLYPDDLLKDFSPSSIAMSRALPLYCPKHVVLMPDEAGTLSIFHNEYGDGMKFSRGLDIPLSSLPEEARRQVSEGLGFDSVDELEQWLEAMDS